MPKAHLGLGEPAFIYYSPLYFFIITGIKLFINDTWLAMKLAAVLSAFSTGVIVYLFCARLIETRLSLIAAAAVVLSPFIYFILHYNNAAPWYTAVPFAAAVLYFSFYSKKSYSIPLSLALAGLICTHILSAFMLLLCLPAMFVSVFLQRGISEGIRHAIGWVASVTIGFGLAAIYLIPAMTTWELINPQAWWKPNVDWRNSFAFPIATASIYGIRWFGVQWVIASNVFIIVFITSLGLFKFSKARDGLWYVIFSLACIAWAAIFLSSELSYPLWALSDFLQKVQWPYRFLYVATIAGGIAISLELWRQISLSISLTWRILPISAILLSIALGLTYLVNILHDGRSPDYGAHTLATHFGQSEYVTSSRGPRWREYVTEGGLGNYCEKAGATCVESTKKAHEYEWVINSQGSNIALPIFAFPAWNVAIDGQEVKHNTAKSTGLVQAYVQPGEHNIKVTWKGLPQENVGKWISIVSCIILIFLIVFSRLSQTYRPR